MAAYKNGKDKENRQESQKADTSQRPNYRVYCPDHFTIGAGRNYLAYNAAGRPTRRPEEASVSSTIAGWIFSRNGSTSL